MPPFRNLVLLVILIVSTTIGIVQGQYKDAQLAAKGVLVKRIQIDRIYMPYLNQPRTRLTTIYEVGSLRFSPERGSDLELALEQKLHQDVTVTIR